MIFNLRRDVYERAYFTSNSYYDWMLDRVFFFGAAQDYVAEMLESFKEFPPRQKAGSFGIDQVMERLQTSGGAN
jgi:arylsulfatase